jgi:enoyl-CoA hydratase
VAEEQIVKTERDGRVGVVLMNRPEKLNALSSTLLGAVADAMEELDADPEIRAIVLGGGVRAFAAGADIEQLDESTPESLREGGRISPWARIQSVRTPIVAAVSGYALGGGCELAMLCDLVVAAESAQFGQPEINLGIIPGAGGTQRLPLAVGKALAMDMVLTGRRLGAREALQAGLVARVVADEMWLEEAKRVAAEIASKSPVATQVAKDSVNKAFETPLHTGLSYERQVFGLARASEDAAEGLRAFLEKREASFKGR